MKNSQIMRNWRHLIKSFSLDIFDLHKCLLVMVLLAPFHANSTDASRERYAPPVIIDTDMAFDDWLAVYLLLRNENVLLITIAGTGETYCDAGVSNARYLMRLAKRPHIPVACGKTEPLNGFHVFPKPWRVESSEMRARESRGEPVIHASLAAVSLMTHTLRNARVPVRIVALGPLTNIAELLKTQQSITEKISDIFIMGGAIDVPGNIKVPGFTDNSNNIKSEWNFYIDPASASTVLRHKVKKKIIPLDATRFAPISTSFVNQLGNMRGPAAQFFHRSYMALMPQINAGHLYFWDVAAAVCAMSKKACRFQDETLRVVEELVTPDCQSRSVRCEYVEETAGALAKDPHGFKTSYATSLDKEAVLASIFETLKNE